MYDKAGVRASLSFALALTLFSAGCDRVIGWVVPDDADLRARRHLELLAAGQLDSVERRLDPELRSDSTRAELATLATYLPGPKFDTVRIIRARTHIEGGRREVTLTYRLASGQRRAQAVFATLDSGGTWMIKELNVVRETP